MAEAWWAESVAFSEEVRTRSASGGWVRDLWQSKDHTRGAGGGVVPITLRVVDSGGRETEASHDFTVVYG